MLLVLLLLLLLRLLWLSSEPPSLAAMRRRDEQEELMALVDTDGDDCIDLEEFIAVCGGEPVFASNAVRCTKLFC